MLDAGESVKMLGAIHNASFKPREQGIAKLCQRRHDALAKMEQNVQIEWIEAVSKSWHAFVNSLLCGLWGNCGSQVVAGLHHLSPPAMLPAANGS